MVTWLDSVVAAWFILTGVSVVYVAWDAFTRNPELAVMKWGWVLVTCYGGPVAAAVYVLSCKEPAPLQHEAFIRPLWKQSLGSTIHCLAGDATGIVAAAAITAALGLPMWLDVVVEYLFGFAFGLLVFQALFMKDMLGGSYVAAVRKAFMPEWLSMNAVMAGMAPVMVILMSRDMRVMDATSLRFWGTMSLATLAGLAVAYPVNLWLVGVKLKHGMGTSRALGQGGQLMGMEQEGLPGMDGGAEHRQHPAGSRQDDTPAGPQAPEEHGSMDMSVQATGAQIAAMTLLTLLLLAAGLVVAALAGDLLMR